MPTAAPPPVRPAAGPARGVAADAAAPRDALSVGIVVYRSDPVRLEACLARLGEAARGAGLESVELFVIDNGPADDAEAVRRLVHACAERLAPCVATVIAGHGNVGYGRGHNLAIERSRAAVHLILNPDAELEPDALRIGLGWLEARPEVVLVAASTFDGDGRPQPLVKTYPSVAVLAIRALGLPFGERLRRDYDLVQQPGECTDVTRALVSGSFMLCRSSALRAVGGFDPGYFLYFEDFDLSLRLSALGRLHWLRDVRLVHHGGAAARKGWLHRRLFVTSAWRFFATHGWRAW